jgi:peptidoglycan-associated lipoprotein
MNMNAWLRVAIVLLFVVAMGLGVGCAKKKAMSTPDGTAQGTSMEQGQGAEMTVEAKMAAAQSLEQAKGVISRNKIYFDFDKFDLKPAARGALKAKAVLLKKYSNVRILIEGHCDDRGTAEYNLALGERRARAAYEFLVLLGVRASQLEMVSYGEEYPADPANNETAWAKNRRDEFKIIP